MILLQSMKLASLKKDKLNFYNEIIDKGKNNIISIDESFCKAKYFI